MYNPHGFVVVCAVNDESSMSVAENILYQVTKLDLKEKSVILVANKADLVRNREIKTNTAKQLAVKYGVKYIETSPGTRLQ